MITVVIQGLIAILLLTLVVQLSFMVTHLGQLEAHLVTVISLMWERHENNQE